MHIEQDNLNFLCEYLRWLKWTQSVKDSVKKQCMSYLKALVEVTMHALVNASIKVTMYVWVKYC